MGRKVFLFLIMFVGAFSVFRYNQLLRLSDGYNLLTQNDVTVTFMSCNRLELLQKTIDSFEKYNTYHHIERKIILIDCFNLTLYHSVIDMYGSEYIIVNSTCTKKNKNKKLMSNLQQLSEMVNTKYWFACEDDWEFIRPSFIEASKSLLEQKLEFMQSMLRQPNTFKPHVNSTYGWHILDSIGLKYSVLKLLSGAAGAFTSFTANPSLIRMKDKRRYINDFRKFKHEADVSKYLGRKYNLQVAIFNVGYYDHLGYGYSTMSSI